MHRLEPKIESEVKTLCNKPSQQTKSMKRIKWRITETTLCHL
jgi:hypothetical protein